MKNGPVKETGDVNLIRSQQIFGISMVSLGFGSVILSNIVKHYARCFKLIALLYCNVLEYHHSVNMAPIDVYGKVKIGPNRELRSS